MTFAVISRSEPAAARAFRPPPAGLQRSSGTARLGFARRHGATRLATLYQEGSAKIRLPHAVAGEPAQAILINTAGGLTGGDRLATEIDVGAGCRAIVTSQACERIYRSAGGAAQVATRLAVGEGARLDWLPQETILFDRGRLERRVEADLAPGAALVALEAAIFGRQAMGETVGEGLFRDRWRIRRGGRLVFADDLRLEGTAGRGVAGLLARPAVAAGGGAIATIVKIGDGLDRHLDLLRGLASGDGIEGGASAWDGRLVLRLVAPDGARLRRALAPALAELLDGAALPRIWQS